MPTFIEYWSFCQYCSGCVCGASHEYIDFHNLMYLKGHYSNMPQGTIVNMAAILNKLQCALFCILIFVFGNLAGFNLQFCGEPEYLTYGSWFSRVGYYHVSMTV